MQQNNHPSPLPLGHECSTDKPMLQIRPRRCVLHPNQQSGLHTVVIGEKNFLDLKRVNQKTSIPMRTILDEASRFYLTHVQIHR